MPSSNRYQLIHFSGNPLSPILIIAGVLLVVSIPNTLAGQEPADVPEAPLIEQETELPTGALFEKVRELIENGDIRDAAAEIDRVVASPADTKNSADIHRSRRWVGLAFAKINNAREAWDEQKKLLDFELADLSDSVSLGQVPITLVGMFQLAVPIDRLSETNDACDQAEKLVAALSGNGPVGPAREVLSKIRFVKAGILIQMSKQDEALKILEADRAELGELVAANTGDRLVLGLYVRALSQLTAHTNDIEKRDALLAEQQAIMANEIKSMPGNADFLRQFITLIAARIQLQLVQENSGSKGDSIRSPETAMELVVTGRAAIEEFFKANPATQEAMQPFRAQFEQLASVVENQMKLPDLIGTRAVPLTANTWINGDGIDEAERAGKVILLDFWSAWIAPTPSVLAFNKSLQDKYGSQGLQIIGVTRYFNIRWNFADRVPQKSDQLVPQEEENDAIALFLEKHDVSWPSMVVDDVSQLQKNYAVSVLPHCVLIDRKGMIRMIKVGFNEPISVEIESTVKKLLAEDN